MRKTWRYLVPGVLLIPVTAAFVGGWATITVEELPDYMVAGQPTELVFTIRQHGVNPMDELAPTIEARNGSQQLRIPGRPGKTPGEYFAALTLPAAGDWKLMINSGFGASKVALLPMRAIAAGSPAPASLSDFERGHRLFVAKGCVTCHVHSGIEKSGEVKAGPDLSVPRLAADYLKKFLADPSISQTRSDMRMPNLKLDAKEIDALVAFVNQEKPAK